MVGLSPVGLRRVIAEQRFGSIEGLVRRAVCLTCLDGEFFGRADIYETPPINEVILYRDVVNGPRLDRRSGDAPAYGVEDLADWP